MHRQGYSNRAAARSAVRNATVRRSLARGRVPIFSIEENWGKRRGEGTPPYGWGRVRCGFLMCGTAGRGVVW